VNGTLPLDREVKTEIPVKSEEVTMRTGWLFVALMAMLPVSSIAQMTPAFGPKQYMRTTGHPNTFTDTFSHCGTQPCQIVVVNGNADGSDRVSSGSISLNGVQVVGPSDFNQRIARIVKPVALAVENQLTVTLASKPGSFITVEVDCLASPVVLSAVAPGVSLLNPTSLLSAFQITNTGTAAATNVQVTAITLVSGTLTSPTLPVSLGTIPIGGFAVVNADFFGGLFISGNSYALTVSGTYAVGASTYCFTLNSNLIIPPAAPGSRAVTTTTVGSNTVSGAPFPPRPPNFGPEQNGAGWTVPTGPFVSGTPTPIGTGTQTAPLRDPGTVVFTVNNGAGLNASTCCTEPSGASGGGVVFVTANFLAAYSTDGGSTFPTHLDPTTIFPNDNVGLCCDQIVQYVPSIDRFIWLLQGTDATAVNQPNGVRIASARPADIINSGGTAWTYWNLTPDVFGEPIGTGFDYPDLSVGNNYLYMSWDVGWPGCPTGCNSGHLVARTPLSQIQAGGTISIDYTTPSDSSSAWGAHLSQNTQNEIFWAGHPNNSTTSLRVFSLAEGSGAYFWRDIGTASWSNTNLTSTTPDGQDWLSKASGFPGNAVIGATRAPGPPGAPGELFSDGIWFAWDAGTDGNFSQPHIEMVTLDRSNNFSLVQQVQIWNGGFAFAYPALATNACTGEVGLSLETGGNGNYENHAVGFWGDFLVYITTGSNVGTGRFGDYVTIRQAPATGSNPGNLFDAFGYGLDTVPPPGSGTQTDVRYVSFGRPASSCPSPTK
jgi:hypothetical protein